MNDSSVQSQTMIVVRDVEASSRWYQQLLGLQSDHGGPDYERLVTGGVLVLQLHNRDVAHHHGLIARSDADVGNGVLLWFGEVSDFDGVVARTEQLRATVVKFLPLTAERFPRQGIRPLAKVAGLHEDGKPTVLFL